MHKCVSECVAVNLARENGGWYGLSVTDGKFYIGTYAQLKRLPVVNVKRPPKIVDVGVDERDEGGGGGDYPRQNLSCFV